nr:uncharacterized protein LOC104116151 [Nicotiana tomentosiformis]
MVQHQVSGVGPPVRATGGSSGAARAVSERPPWYADVAKFLASGWLPRDLFYDQIKKVQDGIIRRCVHKGKMASIISHFHDGATGGHYGGNCTATKVVEADFYWPTL